MSLGYYPENIDALLPFLEKFEAALRPLAERLGITPDQLSAVVDSSARLRAAFEDHRAKHAAALEATAAYQAALRETERRIRWTVRFIKTQSEYTPDLGAQLGVEQPEPPAGPPPPPHRPVVAARRAVGPKGLAAPPVLQLLSVAPREVVVTCDFRGHDMVDLWRARSGEPAFRRFARKPQETLPFDDNRPNRAGAPTETRYYIAQFFDNDVPVSPFSEVLEVAVPGGQKPL